MKVNDAEITIHQRSFIMAFLPSSSINLIRINAAILIRLHRCKGSNEPSLFSLCYQASGELSYIVCYKISGLCKCRVLIHMVTIRNLGKRLILLSLIIKQRKKKLILNKELLPVLCTFLKTVESYIIRITFDERNDSNQIEV